MNELVVETDFVRSVNTFLKDVLQTYSMPTGEGLIGSGDLEMFTARGLLLAQCGRLLLKVGTVLEQVVKKATAQRQPLSPEARLRILSNECADKFNRVE